MEIFINKNRGWRGLAEVHVRDTEDRKNTQKMIFSFSEPVWRDLMHGTIVLQDTDNYYVYRFDNTDDLPQGHQRSVLIKNFEANITKVNKYAKTAWTAADADDWCAIRNFMKNKNNHTQSDWNCIGIRVIPEI